jgi:hypothetical protein
MENGPIEPIPGNSNELPFILASQPTKLEAYAFAGSSLGAAFGHLEGLHGQRRFIKDLFPHLKRLYLFTMAWIEDGSDMHDQPDNVCLDFDAVTNVELIAVVVVQGREPASDCPREASVYVQPNGTIVLKHIVIDQPLDKQELVTALQ